MESLKKRTSAFLFFFALVVSGCEGMPAPESAANPTDDFAPTFAGEAPDTFLSRLLDPRNEMPEDAVRNAYAFYEANQSIIKNKRYLTIIDFNASSRTKRMHLIDMNTGAIERYLVAHGKNSGNDFATMFSNVPETNKSSIGFYLTGTLYTGSNGLSMNLHGLESTNSNAYVRRIVVHGSDYVSDEIARTQPRLGRSLGCPAVDRRYYQSIITRLKEGSLYYIYYDAKAAAVSGAREEAPDPAMDLVPDEQGPAR